MERLGFGNAGKCEKIQRNQMSWIFVNLIENRRIVCKSRVKVLEKNMLLIYDEVSKQA